MAPRSSDAFWRGGFKGFAHGIGQGFHWRGGAIHVRGRLLRVAQRGFFAQIDGDAAVQAFVIRRRHLGKHHQAQIHARHRIACIRIDEIRHLWWAVDADVHAVAGDVDVGRNCHRTQAMTRIFQHRFAVVRAIGNGAYQVAHVVVGHVFQFGNGGLYGV